MCNPITTPEQARDIGQAELQRQFDAMSVLHPAAVAKTVTLEPNETVVTQEYLSRVFALLDAICVACQGTEEFDDEVPHEQWNEVCEETELILGRFDR